MRLQCKYSITNAFTVKQTFIPVTLSVPGAKKRLVLQSQKQLKK